METVSDEITQGVVEIIKRNAAFNADKINDKALLKRDYGIDSIKMVELIMDIEAEFGIKVENSALHENNFGTLERIIRYVSEKRSS